jgi:hypothetical protein
MQSLLKINLAGTLNSSSPPLLQRSQYYENCYYTTRGSGLTPFFKNAPLTGALGGRMDNYVPSCINTFDGQLPEQIVNTSTAVILPQE